MSPGAVRASVRLAREPDLDALAEIERAAAALFRRVGIDGAFLDATTPRPDLEAACADGRLWVATIDDGAIAGFALVRHLDGAPHLEEIDVHPAHGRRGLGSALVRVVQRWVQERGARSLTLSTFRDVPWNAPFYERLGFRAASHDELGPSLRELVAIERDKGLPMERRILMRWDATGDD